MGWCVRIESRGFGDRVSSQPEGFSDKVAFVWKVADMLRGHFKPHEYGSVMLPLLVLRRLDAVLERRKPAVVAQAVELATSGLGMLTRS